MIKNKFLKVILPLMGTSKNSFLLQIAAKTNLFVVSQNLSSMQLWLRLWNISTSALILISSLLFITKRVNRGALMLLFCSCDSTRKKDNVEKWNQMVNGNLFGIRLVFTIIQSCWQQLRHINNN